MLNVIQKKWEDINKRLSGTEDYWYLTPTNYAMYKILNEHLRENRFQNLLDVGAGNLTFKFLTEDIAKNYFSLDIKKNHEDLDIVSSGDNLPIKDNMFDLVICSAVLEHTPEPVKIINEIYRVLSNSGKMILTVPHFHYIHGEPNDYWRFTKYGIHKLIEHSYFEYSEIEIVEVGYFINFCFCLFIPLVLGILLKISVLEKIVLKSFKYLTIFIEKLDKLLSVKSLSLGYVVFVTNNKMNEA